MTAVGNTTPTRHLNLNPGDHFYRLKMIDLDGSWRYSPIVQLKMESGPSSLMVYPNPTKGIVSLKGVSPHKQIYLTDDQGRRLNHYQGVNEIDLSPYPSGIYFLLIKEENNTNLWRQQIIKQD